MFHSSKIALCFALVATLGLGACTKPDGKPDGVNGNSGVEGTASFLVKSVEGSGILEEQTTGIKVAADGTKRVTNWRPPRFVKYTFSACIRDRATRRDAEGQIFRVEIPDKKIGIEDVTPTRPGGCFTWRETIPFSFFVNKSRWVVVERDIVGTEHHTGRQRVRLLINPWAAGQSARDSGKGVRYEREEPLPKERLVEPAQADAALSGELQGPDELFVENVSIQTIRNSERSTGTFVRFNVTMDVKVLFQNEEGRPGKLDLPAGDFYVVGHLVASNTGVGLKDHTILTSGLPVNVSSKDVAGGEPVNGMGRVIDGKLIARMDAWIEKKVAQGNLRLAIKLIPRGIKGLSTYEGIYELGNLRSWASTFSGSLIEECRDKDTPCSVSSYLKDAQNFDELKSKRVASDNPPYLFERVSLRFIQIQPGETTTQRTVVYRASTCVIDSFTGDKVVGLPLTVRYKGTNAPDETHQKVTLSDGCISWNSTIFHYYYNPEEFIEKVVTIEKDAHVKKELKFYINPWDDKFTFGFDEADFPKDIKEKAKIESRFFLADYGYHTVRFQYNIDSLMALEVKKTVLMELQPQVLRYSGIINARKMTEPLRDGIWLMKVAIQKNYLDPAQAGVVIDKLQENQAKIRLAKETPAARESARMHTRLRDMGITAEEKEYVSTQTTLVRVTDGVIIHPVELTMQDLRLMRMRTNFLVQLEPVDERKIWADNLLRDKMKDTIDGLLEKRKQQREKFKSENLSENEKDILDREEKEIQATVRKRIEVSQHLFNDIRRQLDATGAYRIDLSEKKYQADSEYLAPIKKALSDQLQTNDFTLLKLPSCRDIDCNAFIEENTGLKRRTFVGPAIFLHNAYKDSVRATDNLDEARCGTPVEYADEFEAVLREKQKEMFEFRDQQIAKTRPNNLYNYSEYFGSLRHFCNAHVDDLIDRERQWKLLYEKSGPAIASVHNFSKAYNVDFLSLRNEQPKFVEATPEKIRECNGDLVSCMTETVERWIPLQDGLSSVNALVSGASWNSWGPSRWVTSAHDDILEGEWSAENVRSALFDTKPGSKTAYDLASPRSSRAVGCALLMSNLVDQVRAAGGKVPWLSSWDKMKSQMFRQCMTYTGGEPVLYDRKLRVFKTGQDRDPYIFLGGMQLNLNVGQSFSVSRSDSYNWSWGVDAVDSLSWASKILSGISTLVKPFSLKAGGSQSMSDSDGTTISDSTYLVSQIAGFQVRLDEFERCVVMRFAKELVTKPNTGQYPMVGNFVRANQKILDSNRGVMVCEGQLNPEPRQVKESYFYFTQHFTEGDMLDQADLYNHPWLLALRGQRDFGVFLKQIRQQEGVTIGNFVKGVWNGRSRLLDWPLDHMLNIYKHVTPSFPGFYTELMNSEVGTELPLERSMSKIDNDPNCEVMSSDRRSKIPGAPTCNQVFGR